MAQKDYYNILGVSKTASQSEIKSAYRKLAKQYHPDLHPNDQAAAEKFKEINEAYSIVGDEDKRARYDRGEMDDPFGGGGYNPFQGGGFGGGGFEDIFEMFSDAFNFGGARSRRGAQSAVGSDITVNVELSFMESILGCKRPISFSRIEKCPACDGTGAKSSEHMRTCDKCGGSGQVRRVQESFFGQRISVVACDKCGGKGKIITEKCSSCGGKGVVNKNKRIDVSIPAGVENGTVLQLSGEGNAPQNGIGRNGNLLLVVSVKPSKIFQRDGHNLHVQVPISFVTAVCGGEVEIPAPDGKFITRIAEGTKNGEVLRFRGKGVKSNRGYAGDLFATVVVEVPKNISRAQRKALEEFQKESSSKQYPEQREYLEEMEKLYK